MSTMFNAPLYVVPKSTPTISLSCAGLALSRWLSGAGLWFELGLNATGMLPDLALKALATLCFLSISFLQRYGQRAVEGATWTQNAWGQQQAAGISRASLQSNC
jgi:hypothetical protein